MDYENEEWRDVVGYEGLYQVSDMGRVQSLDRVTWIESSNKGYFRRFYGQLREPQNVGSGYLQLNLNRDGIKEQFYVHALVLRAFIGECPINMERNHLDGNKHNNRLDNLEYCTRSENEIHKRRILKILPPPLPKGEEHWKSVLTEEGVRSIRKLYRDKKFTQVELAKMFDTSQTNISGVVNNLTWKDI